MTTTKKEHSEEIQIKYCRIEWRRMSSGRDEEYRVIKKTKVKTGTCRDDDGGVIHELQILFGLRDL